METVYLCNPEAAVYCGKSICFLKGGECKSTKDPECAVMCGGEPVVDIELMLYPYRAENTQPQ